MATPSSAATQQAGTDRPTGPSPSIGPEGSEQREPGAALVAEAKTALHRRRWSEATTILQAAKRLRPHDTQIDDLLLAAAGEDNNRSLVNELHEQLTERAHRSASTSNALAVVALRRRRFLEADHLARTAVELDRANPNAWGHLAASYAGLGWFAETHECLHQAEQAGGADPETRWRVGRAINHWALGHTRAAWIAILLLPLVGALAAGIALTVPFVARELRVGRLDPELAGLAELAWRDAIGLRLLAALGVLASIGLWALAIGLASA